MRKNAKTDVIPDGDAFRELLRKRSMRATPQRMAVHEAMTELIHGSAEDVCEYISSKGDCKITTASVYNILSQLSDLGIYSKRLGASNKMVFDVKPYAHIHLYDSRNDGFVDVVDDELMELVSAHMKSKRFKGYKVDRIDIQIVAHPTRRGRRD